MPVVWCIPLEDKIPIKFQILILTQRKSKIQYFLNIKIQHTVLRKFVESSHTKTDYQLKYKLEQKKWKKNMSYRLVKQAESPESLKT